MTIQDKPKYRVLLVDDEKEQLNKIKDIIEQSNSLKEFIESLDTFLVNPQKGTEEITNQIKENPAHWNIILSDLFMPTNEGKGSLGGLLIADALIPEWDDDPEFPVKLIIISNKGAAGGKLREYSPKYDKWIYWYPKPKITPKDTSRNDLAPQPLWSLAIAEAIVKLNQDIIEEPITEEVLEIGLSGSMRIVKTLADIASKNKNNVLILGEKGTGKEVLARYIHAKLFGKEAPFVKLDCQRVPLDCLLKELFGAVPNCKESPRNEGKIGKFDEANKGTIFLNEIGEIKNIYKRLLDVLDTEERKFRPEGAKEFKKFEGKIICASSEPLDELVDNGLFPREFYEISKNRGFIKLTPLRERKADIIPLANYFIRNYLFEFRDEKKLSEKAINLLKKYNWPDTFEGLKTAVDLARLSSSTEESISKEDIVPLTNYFLKKYSLKFRDTKKLSEDAVNLLGNYNWPSNVKELKVAVDQAMLSSDTEELIPSDFYEILKKVTTNSENCATGLPETNLSALPPEKFVLKIKGKGLLTLIKETGLNESTLVEKIQTGYTMRLNEVTGRNITKLAKNILKYKHSQSFYEALEKFGLKYTRKTGFYSSKEK